MRQLILLTMLAWIATNIIHGLRIGIVGGGPTGVLVSRLIRERRGDGVDEIVIFEAQETIAPIIVTHRIDNDNNGITPNDKAIDITANFIPSKSFVPQDPNQFTGIYGKLQDIFDEVENVFGLNTTLTNEHIDYYNIVNNTVELNPVLVRVFNGEIPSTQFVTEFITMFAILYDVTKYTKSISDVYKLGICVKGESIFEWGQRNQLSIGAEYLSLLSTHIAAEITNLNKTGSDHSCSYILRRSSMLAMETFRLPLQAAGINGDNPAIDAILGAVGSDNETIQFVKDALNAPPSEATALNFHFGYRVIFESIAEIEKMYGVTIHLNAKVTSIESVDGRRGRYSQDSRRSSLRVKTRQRWQKRNGRYKEKMFNYYFDAVFVTIRPIDAIDILDKDDTFKEAYNLYDEAKNECGSFSIGVFNTDDWFNNAVQGDAIFAVGNAYDLNEVGGPGFYKILQHQCFPHGFYHDFLNEPYFGANAYTPRWIDEDGIIQFMNITECIELMIEFLNDVYGFNLVIKDDLVLSFQPEYYPYIISPQLELNDWYQRFEAIQGKNGVFYAGEVFSGQAIFNILRYLDQNMDDMVTKLEDIEEAIDGNYCVNDGYYGMMLYGVGSVLIILNIIYLVNYFCSSQRKYYQKVISKDEDEI